MVNIKNFQSLLLTLIALCLLLGCQASSNATDKNVTNNSIVAKDNSRVSSAVKELDELKKAHEEFKQSSENLINQLQQVAEKKKNVTVDSKIVNDQLEKLRQANNNLRQKNISEYKDNLDKINTIIDEIDKAIAPLKNGFKKETVEQLQLALGLPEKNSAVKKNLGIFGPTTQNYVKKFLNDQNKILSTTIQELAQVNRSSDNSNNKNTQTTLETSNQQFPNILVIPVVFIAGVVIGAMGMHIYYKRYDETSHEEPKNYDYTTELNPSSPVSTSSQTFNNKNSGLRTPTQTPEPISPTPPQQINSHNSQIHKSSNTQQPSSNPSNSYLIHNSSDIEFIAIYNQNRNSLSKYAVEVSETKESINQRRLGINQVVILEKVSKGKGNYWIINQQDQQGIDYLVPKGNIKINEYNYETVESLFHCKGYQSGGSSDFILTKPARVTSVSQYVWRLVETGVLNF